MKKIYLNLIAGILILLLLSTLVGFAAADNVGGKETAQADQAADPLIDVDAQQYWREIIQKYRDVDEVKQLVMVRYTGGCSARVLLYEKQVEEGNAWSLVFETEGYVGKYGIGKTKEGDAMTPIGDFEVQKAFGIRNNPGTALDYINVTSDTYACDEEGDYYNQIIDSKETGHKCAGEEMYKYSPEYNYGFTIDFNADNTYPDGSAVFFHCIGPKKFTGGCIAIPEEYMVQLLKEAEPGMRIIINKD